MKLNIGDKAPVFQGKDQDGNEVNLNSFLGKKVVLYFYPNDDTPGCTAQSCNLRDNYDRMLSQGYEVIGISGNDEESHRKFREKYNLPFTLIADTDKSINELYGVWKEKNMYGNLFMGTVRTTFVIDEYGYILDIITKVDKENHAEQILNPGALNEMPPMEPKEENSLNEKETAVKAKKVVKKTATKKNVSSKKAPAKKVVAKKKVVKVTAKKKPAAKKKPVKKATAKKPVAKKTSPKKKAAPKKKVAAKKAVIKKASPKKKAAPKKKVAVKKAVVKKAAPKKKVVAKKKVTKKK